MYHQTHQPTEPATGSRRADMSLWTPDGEHQVPRESTPGPAAQPASAPADAAPTEAEAAQAAGMAEAAGMPDLESLSPEERAQVEAMAQEMAEVREQLASVPASTVVANHAMGLYELGAIHLSNDPPNLPEAKVAIDAMTAIIEKLDGRLGEAEPTLKEAITQIQMAFVQLSSDASS